MPLPSTFNPIHRIDPGWIFNPRFKKQTNPQTVLADGDLTDTVPFEGAPILRKSDIIRSDIEMTGKGHGFATALNHKQVARDIDGTRSFQLNSLIGGYLSAGLLQSISSVQPNVGANPTAWRHTMDFVNVLTAGRASAVTTIYEEPVDVSGWRKKLRAAAIDRLTISGNRRDPLQIAADIVTSGEDVEDDVAVPTVSSVDILDGGNLTFKIGALAGGVDVSDRLSSWRVVLANNIDRANGYFPGSAKFRERFWIGRQRVEELSFNLYVRAADADFQDIWKNETKQEVDIKVTGAQIGSGPEVHDYQIFFPSLRLSAPEIAVEDDWHVYQFRLGPDRIYKDPAAAIVQPVRIVVTNTTATGYLP